MRSRPPAPEHGRLRPGSRPALVMLAGLAWLLLAAASPAEAKVVNENRDDLPPGCDAVSEDVAFTVRGGREHAEAFPGTVFTFDERNFDVPPCARVTVTFINEDPIRHQFMVHGTFPHGFFQIELDGEGEENGTFVVGGEPRTRLIHCGLPQHQQKGMKAQLLVNGGQGTLPNIPGISGLPPEDRERIAAFHMDGLRDLDAGRQEEGPGGEGTDGPRPIPSPGAPFAALVGLLVAVVAALVRRTSPTWPRHGPDAVRRRG